MLIEIEPNLTAIAALCATEEEIKTITKASHNKEKTIKFHCLIAKASKNCLSENLIKLLYSTTNIFINNLINNGEDDYEIKKITL